MHAGSLELCTTLCDPVDCGLPGFSVRGFSRQEYWSVSANTGCHAFYSTVFPAALASNSPEYLVLPEPLRPKQRHHLRTWPHRADPSPPEKSQEQTPVDDPHAEVEIKPELKPKGSVAKEEDPKASHQLYKLQIKST